MKPFLKSKCSTTIVMMVIFSGIAGLSFGQQAGEVKDQEFVIRKDRVLTLPKQTRKFDRIPVLPSAKSSTSFNYIVQPYFLSLPPEVIKPEVAQKQWPRNQEEMFPGFARLGYGNYSSPIIEGRYNYWEEEDYNFGVKLKHEGFYQGPVDGSNSGENFTNIKADGSLYKDFIQFYGGIEYDRHEFKFYGYDPENPLLEDYVPSQNVLNTFKLKAGLQDIDKLDFLNYDASLEVRTFNDQYSASESEIGIKAFSDFRFDEALKTTVNMQLSLTDPKDVLYNDINRNYFKVNPFVSYLKKGIYVKAGANLVFENDVALNKKSDFHVFPQVYGHYLFADEFGIYAGFEGDVQRKTYLDFVNENQFLGPSESLLNTIQNYIAKAGIKGTLNDELTYEAGVSVGKFTNMHFFTNSPSDTLRFNIVYDDDTRVMNYSAKIGWQYDDWYRLIGKANYYYYNTSNLEAAFHRPEWELSLNNNFTFAKKWLIQANANLMGGIQAFVDNGTEDSNLKTLPAILDLQLKADYQINERISAFAVGNNLLNKQNQRFLNYPVRGIQGILGITVRF
ncbi:TonB-dependent receptor [Shivajiella indica]|uniref:TonB-dependent receptor n=1 Tax=Shivajiella indica TaxID=872115 RepID=A0ABW5B5V0_9BACT